MAVTEQSIGITGAKGFIGRHFTALLQTRHIQFSVFQGNLLERDALIHYFNTYKPQTIVHLAGRVSGTDQSLMRDNVHTTRSLLEIGQEKGLKKIIFASTGAVYGEPAHPDGSQENDVPHPNTAYGESKFQAETLILDYFKNQKISYTILRFPSIYGPQNSKGVVYEMLESIRKNKRVNISGDGSQSRQFLEVTAACDALFQALTKQLTGIWNVSPAHWYTIRQIVDLLKNNYRFSVVKSPANNHLMHMRLDPSKWEKNIGVIQTRLEKDLSYL